MSTGGSSDRYREAGVDIDRAGDLLRDVRKAIAGTFDDRVLGGIGGFGGLFRLETEGMAEPVLVSSIDGVGTKLRVALMAGRHDTVGEDLVNHCVNDIGVQGAEPLFFLDYLGTSRLRAEIFPRVIEGLVRGCRRNGCALIGGETAEMPGLYHGEDYDLVGCIVGVVDRHRLIDGTGIRPGDVVLGVASTGLHTNGYSLARKVLFETLGYGPETVPEELGESVADALLKVHASYLPVFRALRETESIHGFAHLTGGGWFDNIRRILPEGCRAVVRRGSWPVPPIFGLIRKAGRIDDPEMHRVFNMGIGLAAIVDPAAESATLDRVRGLGFGAWTVGTIIEGARGVELTGGTQ